eukprot:567070-Rhodomonas_salina.3
MEEKRTSDSTQAQYNVLLRHLSVYICQRAMDMDFVRVFHETPVCAVLPVPVFGHASVGDESPQYPLGMLTMLLCTGNKSQKYFD